MNSRFLGEESGNRCLGRQDDLELMKDFIKTDKEEYKQGRWIVMWGISIEIREGRHFNIFSNLKER